jgi:hypothetical protein
MPILYSSDRLSKESVQFRGPFRYFETRDIYYCIFRNKGYVLLSKYFWAKVKKSTAIPVTGRAGLYGIVICYGSHLFRQSAHSWRQRQHNALVALYSPETLFFSLWYSIPVKYCVNPRA